MGAVSLAMHGSLQFGLLASTAVYLHYVIQSFISSILWSVIEFNDSRLNIVLLYPFGDKHHLDNLDVMVECFMVDSPKKLE